MPLYKFGLTLFKVIILSIFITSTAICQNKAYKGAEVYGKPEYYIQYGKIEVRMMASKGSGILSTFFTWKEGSEQSNVFWEEIDVEVFGKNNATTWQTNIITGYDPLSTSEQTHIQNFSFGDNFHTYGVEWTPDYVSWFIDGQQVRKVSGQPASDLDNPAGIRFNIWASTSTSWVGPWDENVLPQYQFVNWIKYYRYDNGEFILDWSDDFDSFNNDLWAKANWTFDGNRVDFEPKNVIVQDGMLILCLTKAGETGFTGTAPHDTVEINTIINNNNIFPNKNVLLQNYPNPFNPHTYIEFIVIESTNVSLKVYDIRGSEIVSLINKRLQPNQYKVTFNAEDLSSGIYFYHIQIGNYSAVKRMVLIR